MDDKFVAGSGRLVLSLFLRCFSREREHRVFFSPQCGRFVSGRGIIFHCLFARVVGAVVWCASRNFFHSANSCRRRRILLMRRWSFGMRAPNAMELARTHAFSISLAASPFGCYKFIAVHLAWPGCIRKRERPEETGALSGRDHAPAEPVI